MLFGKAWKGEYKHMNKTVRNLLLAAGCLALAGTFGMTARAEELKEPNPYRQQTVTAMDEYGNITEIGDSDGVIGGGEVSGDRALQSSTSLIVNFNTKETPGLQMPCCGPAMKP